ncbi:MAG TPA: hypothetical protein ENK49_02410 [Gammaproteobacteria bacterium]|nr:hypothetical protein [Gammaproteobacteria bacterium]
MKKKRPFIAFLAGFVPVLCLAGTTQPGKADAVTGVETWETRAHGVSFSLTQILQDQVRAFFVSRGFTLEQIESYATSCVFMAVLRNDDAPDRIHFIRSDWSISSGGKTRPLETVSAWMHRLEAQNASKSALIAFRWSQFPVEQEYEPGGDWNQGMVSVGLPAGSQFGIIARWDINGEPYEAELKEVRCAR